MNIILVSNKFTQARSFAVSTPQVIFLGLLLCLLVVSLAVLMNYFSLRYAVTNQSPYLQSLLEAVQAEQTRKTQSYLRESLNTMAARLGEMQAKLQRLDTLGERLTMPLDVTVDEQIDATAARLAREWGQLDILVHAVAFAPREAIDGSFTANTSREAFRIAHDVSSYSFTALARATAPLMAGRPGAMLTLSYLGAVRSIPNYNVMGLAKASLEANVRFLAADLGPRDIRVNGISAGPIKTLSGAGVGGFRKMLGYVARVAPLRRNVSIEDVGNAATFLCSGMAAGVTGEILYVDSGFSTVGMSFADEAGTE